MATKTFYLSTNTATGDSSAPALVEINSGYTATDLGGFVAGHWWVLALAGGVAAIWYGRQVIEARLADHRSGANTNR